MINMVGKYGGIMVEVTYRTPKKRTAPIFGKQSLDFGVNQTVLSSKILNKQK